VHHRVDETGIRLGSRLRASAMDYLRFLMETNMWLVLKVQRHGPRTTAQLDSDYLADHGKALFLHLDGFSEPVTMESFLRFESILSPVGDHWHFLYDALGFPVE
jgi:hypothetical protein